jgi:hypothetical protein
MDKLEQYLDQVCRRVGGPRSLRQHIRQELREHLRDAVAEHRAAGMSEEEALARALEDFGGPEEVRSELEEAHGHRLMAVVIDKAMQWKEKTMKAKWLWTTWAHLALAGVIAAEVFFITSTAVFIAPKLRMFRREGLVSFDRSEPLIAWVPGFLEFLDWVATYVTWLAIPALVVCILFEWRVRSENKLLIRLSAMGTAALALFVVFVLAATAMVLPMTLVVEDLYAQIPERVVVDKEERINTSINSVEEAMTRKDWDEIQIHVRNATRAMDRLEHWGAAASALTTQHEQQRANELRAQMKTARNALGDAGRAAQGRSSADLEAAMKKFHEAYEQLQGEAKPPK